MFFFVRIIIARLWIKWKITIQPYLFPLFFKNSFVFLWNVQNVEWMRSGLLANSQWQKQQWVWTANFKLSFGRLVAGGPSHPLEKLCEAERKKKKRKTVTTLSFLVAKRCSLQSKLNFPQKKSTLRVSPEQHRCFLLKYHGVPSPSVLDSQLFALKKESVWKSWNLCFQCSRMWKISSTIYKTQRKREINLLFFKSLKLILLRCCFKQAFGGVIKEKLPRGNKVSNTLITTSTTCVCSCLKLVGVCWCESLGKAFSLPKP